MSDYEAGDFRGMPLPVEWLDDLHSDESREYAKELLDSFNTASLWIKYALDKPEDDPMHDQAHVLIGLTDTLVRGTHLIAQIETAKHGDLGINVELMQVVQRSMFSGLLLAGIRFGQQHPEGFLEFDPEVITATLQAVLEELSKGGEAEDDEQD